MNTKKLSVLTTAMLLSSATLASTQPPGTALSYSQRALSVHGNPAAPALIVKRDDASVMQGGMVRLSAGLEYGGVDELFDLIDDIGGNIKPPSGGDNGGGDNGGGNGGGDNGGGIDIDEILAQNPELKDALSAVASEVVAVGGLLAIISTEGYGKAHVGLDIPFIVNDDFLGGTLMFKINTLGTSKVLGITEEINFDREHALGELEKLVAIDENTASQEYDLSGGVKVHYDKVKNKLKLDIENDSLLLVKAAKISKISFGYSRNLINSDAGNLFVGVEPAWYRVGLTNVGASLGDITDSEAIFDNIRNTKFIYQNGFDADIGLVWSAKHYQVGGSINNLIESEYDYPDIDLSSFRSLEVTSKLLQHTSYTMRRQAKFEAGVFTIDRGWSLDLAVDLNAVSDPMQDDYQWASINAGYASDSWWLPSARVGFSKNLAGTKLSYVSAGLTFAKFINFDVSSTLDTVDINGTKLMRGLTASLGVQFDY